MKCPHLTKSLIFTCKAKEKMYHPSSFQLQEYCKAKDHKKCPFYSKRVTVLDEVKRLISVPQC